MESEPQIITFFTLGHIEIPTTIYLPYNAVVQRLQVSVLATEHLQAVLQVDPSVKYINITTTIE